MKRSKLYLVLLIVSVAFFIYSCDSVTDSALQQDDIQSQSLTIDSDAKTKVDVCHLDDEGNYMMISIAEPALKSHEKHGDAQPGEAVPDMDGYVFDETCTPEPVGNKMTACFTEALNKVLAIAPIDELVFGNYSDWSISSTSNRCCTDWFEIETPLNGGKLQLNTFFEGNYVVCGVSYPENNNGHISTFIGHGFSNESFEVERSYLEYLLSL